MNLERVLRRLLRSLDQSKDSIDSSRVCYLCTHSLPLYPRNPIPYMFLVVVAICSSMDREELANLMQVFDDNSAPLSWSAMDINNRVNVRLVDTKALGYELAIVKANRSDDCKTRSIGVCVELRLQPKTCFSRQIQCVQTHGG